MSNIFRNRLLLTSFHRIILNNQVKNLCSLFSNNILLCNSVNIKPIQPCILKTNLPSLIQVKFKHKKNKSQDLTESDEDAYDVEEDIDHIDKFTKVVTVKVNSLRADLILKSGLGIARNKIETAFYDSKIRVNGKKLLKKSSMLSVGDEVDILKGQSENNPNFVIISRIEILSASERSEGLNVKLKRSKNLTIENYED